MFIGRREDGTIYGAFSQQQKNDEYHPRLEEVSDDHPDLLAFIHRDDKIVYVDLTQEIVGLKTRIVELETKIEPLGK